MARPGPGSFQARPFGGPPGPPSAGSSPFPASSSGPPATAPSAATRGPFAARGPPMVGAPSAPAASGPPSSTGALGPPRGGLPQTLGPPGSVGLPRASPPATAQSAPGALRQVAQPPTGGLNGAGLGPGGAPARGFGAPPTSLGPPGVARPLAMGRGPPGLLAAAPGTSSGPPATAPAGAVRGVPRGVLGPPRGLGGPGVLGPPRPATSAAGSVAQGPPTSVAGPPSSGPVFPRGPPASNGPSTAQTGPPRAFGPPSAGPPTGGRPMPGSTTGGPPPGGAPPVSGMPPSATARPSGPPIPGSTAGSNPPTSGPQRAGVVAAPLRRVYATGDVPGTTAPPGFGGGGPAPVPTYNPAHYGGKGPSAPSETSSGNGAASAAAPAPGTAPGPTAQPSGGARSLHQGPLGPAPPGGLSEPNAAAAAPAAKPPAGPAPAPASLGNGNSAPPSRGSARVDPRLIPRPRYTNEITRFVVGSPDMPSPPPVTNPFIAVDEGWASPRFVRMTLNTLPASKDVLEMCNIPMAAIVQPLATPRPGEYVPETVEHPLEAGPVRCSRCRAYINPYCKFTDYGRSYTCNICDFSNEVPSEYYCNLDEYGRRRDRLERPELCRGAVDFAVPKSYSTRPVQNPVYVFALDVSFQAVLSGALAASLRAAREALDVLPRNPSTRVGIVCFDSSMYVFNLHASLSEPQLAEMADTEDPFSPLPPDCWVPNLAESRGQIDAALDRIPELFAGTRRMQSAVGVAMAGVLDGLKDIGGRALFFMSGLPSVGLGKLQNREQPRHYATEKERIMYSSPEKSPYKELGGRAAESRVCIDMFVTAQAFADIPSLQWAAGLTGGNIYHYPSFYWDPAAAASRASAAATGAEVTELPNADDPAVTEHLVADVLQLLRRPMGFDCAMKMRTSKGLRAQTMDGHYYQRIPGEVEVAGCDSTKAWAVKLEHEGDEMTDGAKAYLQFALLYTNSSGERRVRCLNVELNVSSAIANVFRYSDMDATMNVFMRRARLVAVDKDLAEVKDMLTEQAIEILYLYRKWCSPHSSPAQLILPESLKLVPVYFCGALKCTAFRPNRAASGTAVMSGPGRPPASDIRADARATALFRLGWEGVETSVPQIYARMYALHCLPPTAGHVGETKEDGAFPDVPEASRVVLPAPEWTSSAKVDLNGIYLTDVGKEILLYVGGSADPKLLQDLFGVMAANELNRTGFTLPRLETDLSQRAHRMIDQIRADREPYMPVTIITADGPLKAVFTSALVEDRVQMVDSYVEYLCALHAAIQAKMA